MAAKAIKVMCGYGIYGTYATREEAEERIGAAVAKGAKRESFRVLEGEKASAGMASGRCRDCGSWGPRGANGYGYNCGCALE